MAGRGSVHNVCFKNNKPTFSLVRQMAVLVQWSSHVLKEFVDVFSDWFVLISTKQIHQHYHRLRWKSHWRKMEITLGAGF